MKRVIAGALGVYLKRLVVGYLERVIAGALGVYVGLALVGLGLERAGVLRCDCLPECWCKRPLLRPFRWLVANDRHHLPEAPAELQG